MFGLDAWLNSEADYIRFTEGPEEQPEPFPDPYDVMIDKRIEDEAREVGR